MTTAPASDVVNAARRWVGTPYLHQASRLGVGCDCLGLVRGVWRDVVGDEVETVPPYSRDWGEVGAREVLVDALSRTMVQIDITGIASGVVVVFRMRRGSIAKHAGILTGSARFVHAIETVGVIEDTLSEAWLRRAAAIFAYPVRAV